MTPKDVLSKFRDWIRGDLDQTLWAEDVVVETPFAPNGPTTVRGRAEFVAMAKAGRARLPVTIEDMRDVVIHETTDPNKIVVEYDLIGTVLATGVRDSARFIAVMETRDGLITRWREYQNTSAMARKMAAPN